MIIITESIECLGVSLPFISKAEIKKNEIFNDQNDKILFCPDDYQHQHLMSTYIVILRIIILSLSFFSSTNQSCSLNHSQIILATFQIIKIIKTFSSLKNNCSFIDRSHRVNSKRTDFFFANFCTKISNESWTLINHINTKQVFI